MEQKFPERKYDYSKVDYKKASFKVEVICPRHGSFFITPSNLRAGNKCPKCALEDRTCNVNEVLNKCSNKYNNKFNYSLIPLNGITMKSEVIVICPEHGKFKTTLERHLYTSKYGCPICAHKAPRKSIIDGVKRRDMREYRIWKAIKTRTTNYNTDDVDRYINRGIICCKEWLNSFEKFYNDMGPCPEGYSIDRIDNNKGYCKENCRWTTSKNQAENRGDFNIIITYNGETHVLKEWARIFNIKYSCLYKRIKTMPFEKAIQKDPNNRLYELNGVKRKLVDWCKIYNIKYSTVLNRIHKHKWTLQEALITPYKKRKMKIQSELT